MVGEKILLKGKNIYYEIYGQGEPIIILNGIMMSTSSWGPLVDVFSKANKLILIDFLDQGQSDKMEEEYSQEIHVEILNEFIEKLNLGKVHMVGISYGGEIAQRFAVNHEDKLLSLVLANTTSYTNKILKDIGDSWVYAAESYDGSIFFKATMPYIYSGEFYEANIDWLKQREESFSETLTPKWYDGFIRLVRSAEDFDLRESVGNIGVPTLILASEYDATTPVRYQEDLQRKIKGSKLILIKGSGHASMYEKPGEFAASILGFVNNSNKEIKIL